MKEEKTGAPLEGTDTTASAGAAPPAAPAAGRTEQGRVLSAGRRRPARGSSSELLRRMVALSVFAALAYGVTFVLRIKVLFLTFDAKDAILAVATLIYGPVAGIVTSLLTAFLELVTVSDTGLYGFIMNFTSSVVFSVVATGLYRLRRRPAHAAVSLYAAALTMTGAMLLLNLLITPFYMGQPREAVVALIPTLLLPFNLAKGLLNAALAMLLYKPVVTALRRAGMAPCRGMPPVADAPGKSLSAPRPGHTWSLRHTVGMLVIALLTLTVAVVAFVMLRARFAG